VLIRLELSGPGVQYIADNQLYNSIITAHAIIMIFFMVKKYFLLNSHFTLFKVANNNDDSTLNELDNNHNNFDNKNPKNNKNQNNKNHNYVKILIDDPYNNRDIILKVTKRQKGIYI
jgi:alpha-glucuronidase